VGTEEVVVEGEEVRSVPVWVLVAVAEATGMEDETCCKQGSQRWVTLGDYLSRRGLVLNRQVELELGWELVL